MTLALNALAILAALISAVLWVKASRFPTIFPIAWLSGPPSEIQQVLKDQARFNAWAAIATGCAVLLQAVALVVSTLQPTPSCL